MAEWVQAPTRIEYRAMLATKTTEELMIEAQAILVGKGSASCEVAVRELAEVVGEIAGRLYKCQNELTDQRRMLAEVRMLVTGESPHADQS